MGPSASIALLNKESISLIDQNFSSLMESANHVLSWSRAEGMIKTECFELQ